jgi:hypothetical protein
LFTLRAVKTYTTYTAEYTIRYRPTVWWYRITRNNNNNNNNNNNDLTIRKPIEQESYEV